MLEVDAPTPWELQRNYNALREDMRHGFQGINQRLDKVPTADTLAALLEGLSTRVANAEADVSELRGQLQQERDARAADRRLVVGAVLAAVGSLAVMIVSSLIGGGPT